jgi:hypothetical protein
MRSPTGLALSIAVLVAGLFGIACAAPREAASVRTAATPMTGAARSTPDPHAGHSDPATPSPATVTPPATGTAAATDTPAPVSPTAATATPPTVPASPAGAAAAPMRSLPPAPQAPPTEVPRAQGQPVPPSTVALVPDASRVERGQPLTVQVVAGPPADGLGAWVVDLDYDPALLRVTACAADVRDATAVCNAEYGAGTVRLTGASVSGLRQATPIGQVTFEARESGAAELRPRVASAALPTGERTPLEASPATVTVR